MDNKVLLNVEINAKDALESYSKIKIRIDELRDSQKKLKESGLENSKVYIETEQQIKALSKRAQEYQKTIQQNIKNEFEQKGSLQQLKAELSIMTQQYNKLDGAMRNSKEGEKLARNIAQVTERLTKAEVALGNYHRQVGNYELASKALKKEMVDLTNKLQVMRVNQEQNSAEYKNAAERLAEIKDALGKVNQEVAALGNDLASTQAVSQSLGILSNNLNMLSITTEKLNIGVPELQEVLSGLGLASSTLSSILEFQNVVQKESLVYQKSSALLASMNIIQIDKQKKARAAHIAMLKAENLSTKALAATTWLWNAALSANPVVLIIASLTALLALTAGVIHFFGSTAQAERDAADAHEAYEKAARRAAMAISEINAQEKKATDEISNSMREEIVAMQKRGATSEEIAKYRLKREKEIRDAQFSAALDRQVQHEQELKSLEKELKAQEKVLSTIGRWRKKYKEQLSVVEELKKKYNELEEAAYDETQAQQDILIKNQEEEVKAAEEQKKRAQKNAADRMALNKEVADNQLKAQKAADELLLAETDASAMERFKHQQEWERKMFDANQNYEKRRLAMQKKNGEITEQEYKSQLYKLTVNEQAFVASQADATKKQVLAQYKEVINEVGKQTSRMISDVDKQVTDQMASVMLYLGLDEDSIRRFEEVQELIANQSGPRGADMGELTDEQIAFYNSLEEKMFEYYRIDAELKKKAEEQKTAIEQAAVDKRLADAFKAIEDGNVLDLLDYTKTEEEKTNILIKEAQRRIAVLKKEAEAETDPNVKRELLKRIAEEENNIRELNLQNIQNNAAKELANAALSAKEKYRIKQEYLQKELEAIKGNADAEAEVNQQMLENRQEYLNAVADSISEWGGKAVEALSGFADMMNNIEQGHLQDYEAQQEKEKDALKKRLDDGLLSQEEYDKRVAKMDADMEKKQKEIELKQAKRAKAIALMEAIINTAAGIAKAVAENPMMGGLPGSAIAAAMGAIQIATISAQPLPKASRGALLHGKSHAQGGIPIEAEGGEAIINKRSTARYLPLLSAINQAGGGVPLYAQGGMVHQAIRDTTRAVAIDYDRLASACAKMNVQVAVTDINRGQADMAQVVQRKNY